MTPLNYAPPDAFGCQKWLGKMDTDGYPIAWRGRRPARAHRLVYEQELGEIPAGKVLDHTCRNRACVAPHHLEPVTQHENELRKSHGYRSRIKRCKNGHDLATLRVMTPQGGFACRQCNEEAKR